MTKVVTQFNDLGGMVAFLDGNHALIEQLADVLGDIMKQYENRFVEAGESHETLREAVAAAVEETQWTQPAWLIAGVDKRMPAVREEKQKRRSELQAEIASLKRQQEKIDAERTSTISELEEARKKLQSLEKRRDNAYQKAREAVDSADEALKKAAQGLGWLLRFGTVRRLRKGRDEAVVKLYRAHELLTEVRTTWTQTEQASRKKQERLQDAWRLRVAETARLNRELAELTDDFEGAVRRAAFEAELEALGEIPPDTPQQFVQSLQGVKAEAELIHACQDGIETLAELKGRLLGVATGLEKLGESVKKLKSQQDQYSSLARLKLNTPPEVPAFVAALPETQKITADPERAANEPAKTAAAAREIINARLGDTQIERFFTALGEEIDRATKTQW